MFDGIYDKLEPFCAVQSWIDSRDRYEVRKIESPARHAAYRDRWERQYTQRKLGQNVEANDSTDADYFKPIKAGANSGLDPTESRDLAQKWRRVRDR